MNQVRNTIETLNTTHFKMTILYHSFKLIQTEEEENTCFGMRIMSKICEMIFLKELLLSLEEQFRGKIIMEVLERYDSALLLLVIYSYHRLIISLVIFLTYIRCYPI